MGINLHFIKHSSFTLETENHVLLFDYFEGDLPNFPQDKHLLIFSSHFHGDHFSDKIFDITHPEISYILDKGIKPKLKDTQNQDNILFVDANCCYNLGDIKIDTLKSTDEGVAFLIKCDGTRIYHAGDLNHWHWDGEDHDANFEMAKNYFTEIKKLSGKRFDFAFVPVDPRLGTSFDLGIKGFLENANAKTVIPMHMWGDFSVVEKIKEEFPKENILDIKEENQSFNI